MAAMYAFSECFVMVCDACAETFQMKKRLPLCTGISGKPGDYKRGVQGEEKTLSLYLVLKK